MIYGYARVSTDGQSVAAQVAALKGAGAEKIFREVASGAQTARAQLRKAVAALEAGDVLLTLTTGLSVQGVKDQGNVVPAPVNTAASIALLWSA